MLINSYAKRHTPVAPRPYQPGGIMDTSERERAEASLKLNGRRHRRKWLRSSASTVNRTRNSVIAEDLVARGKEVGQHDSYHSTRDTVSTISAR